MNELFQNGYSPTIIKHAKQFTHEMLEAAVDDGYLVANPARKIKLPNMPKTKNEKSSFTPEEEQAIIDFAPLFLTQKKPHVPHKIGKAIIVLLKSGMRQEELLALSWGDINFNSNTIRIHQTVTLNGYAPIIVQKTKTRESTRTIPMHPLVRQTLKNIEPATDKSKTVFCKEDGGIWAQNCFYNLYKS
ncbi:tyrosine-type recombinase/integrase [Ethanoligenens sp.]|uniref:tyrosine-type recombinase/integrase n=1 Tax=Ethanoligenens sp. TaxID=2099655 RepID=UPI0039EB0E71